MSLIAGEKASYFDAKFLSERMSEESWIHFQVTDGICKCINHVIMGEFNEMNKMNGLRGNYAFSIFKVYFLISIQEEK